MRRAVANRISDQIAAFFICLLRDRSGYVCCGCPDLRTLTRILVVASPTKATPCPLAVTGKGRTSRGSRASLEPEESHRKWSLGRPWRRSSSRPSIPPRQNKVRHSRSAKLAHFRTAEATLKTEAKTQPDFLTSLLNLIVSSNVSLPIRQAAALFFKNFVREHWKVHDPPLLSQQEQVMLTLCHDRMMHLTKKSSLLKTAVSSNQRSLHWSPWSLLSCNYPWETPLASSPTQTFTRIGSTLFLYSSLLILLLTEEHCLTVRSRRLGHNKCNVTCCSFCLQTMASSIPNRRIIH
jgi:hypothetical protein